MTSYQVRFIAARAESADGISTLQKMGEGAKMGSGYTTQIVACRPRSVGRVRLRNADALCKPLLERVHLSAEEDVVTLREGIKLGRKLCSSDSFSNYRTEEIYPGADVTSDEAIDAYIRSSVHSANALTGSCRMGRESDALAVLTLTLDPSPNSHPNPGSCRMGRESDALAVLDSELRVRGVGSLRVVDASAMPHIIGGQTCAPTIMMAEKAADMVLAQRAALRRYTAYVAHAEAHGAQAAYGAAAQQVQGGAAA